MLLIVCYGVVLWSFLIYFIYKMERFKYVYYSVMYSIVLTSFRVVKMKTKTIGFKIDEVWYDFLKAKSQSEERTISSLVRLAIRKQLMENGTT